MALTCKSIFKKKKRITKTIHNFRMSTNQRLKSAGKGGNGGSEIGSCVARLELVTGKPRLLEFQFTVLCRYWLVFVCFILFVFFNKFKVCGDSRSKPMGAICSLPISVSLW